MIVNAVPFYPQYQQAGKRPIYAYNFNGYECT